MNQDKNYMTDWESYSNSIKFNLYTFKIFEEDVFVVIKERITTDGYDKSTYNIWKTFFNDLNEGKDYKESSENFIISYLMSENYGFRTGEEALAYYEKRPQILLCNSDLNRIEIVYKKGLRDSRINYILEDE